MSKMSQKWKITSSSLSCTNRPHLPPLSLSRRSRSIGIKSFVSTDNSFVYPSSWNLWTSGRYAINHRARIHTQSRAFIPKKSPRISTAIYWFMGQSHITFRTCSSLFYASRQDSADYAPVQLQDESRARISSAARIRVPANVRINFSAKPRAVLLIDRVVSAFARHTLVNHHRF